MQTLRIFFFLPICHCGCFDWISDDFVALKGKRASPIFLTDSDTRPRQDILPGITRPHKPYKPHPRIILVSNRVSASILKATFDLIAPSFLTVVLLYQLSHRHVRLSHSLRVVKQCVNSSKYLLSRLHKVKITFKVGKILSWWRELKRKDFETINSWFIFFFFRNLPSYETI